MKDLQPVRRERFPEYSRGSRVRVSKVASGVCYSRLADVTSSRIPIDPAVGPREKWIVLFSFVTPFRGRSTPRNRNRAMTAALRAFDAPDISQFFENLTDTTLEYP